MLATVDGISVSAVRSNFTTDGWVHGKSLVEVFFGVNRISYWEQVVIDTVSEDFHGVLNIRRVVFDIVHVNFRRVLVGTRSIEHSLHFIAGCSNTAVFDLDVSI